MAALDVQRRQGTRVHNFCLDIFQEARDPDSTQSL